MRDSVRWLVNVVRWSRRCWICAAFGGCAHRDEASLAEQERHEVGISQRKQAGAVSPLRDLPCAKAAVRVNLPIAAENLKNAS